MLIDPTLLSTEEAALLSKLVKKASTRKASIQKPQLAKLPESYILGVQTTCKTCKFEHLRFFNMVPSEDRNCLVSVPLEGLSHIPKQVQKYTTIVCSNCRVYLASLSKEDVIEKFMCLALDKIKL